MSPENPFSPVHSGPAFHETPEIEEILDRLDEGLGAREPFVLITGEPGTGKTALALEAIARWGDRVRAAFLAYPAQNGTELLEEVIRRLGGEPPEGANRPRLLAALDHALAASADGQVALLVVDEAHDLAHELLNELRLIANAALQSRRRLEVMLIGLPDLESRLEQPELAALRQRVAVRARLAPFSAPEVRRYLHHRVAATGGDGAALFPKRAAREIAALGRGVPRLVNSLAAESLRLAQAAGAAAVDEAHVQAAAAALWGPRVVKTADEEEAPAVSAAPAVPAPPALKLVVSKPPATAVPSAPAASPVPAAPPAPIAEAVPVAVVKPAPPPVVRAPVTEPPAELSPPPVVSHDANEWVKRFVGERPVQIGSRAGEPGDAANAPRETRGKGRILLPEPVEAAAVPEAPEAPPAPRKRRESPPAAARPGHGPDPRAALLAALVMIGLITVVLVAVRVAGNRSEPPAPVQPAANETAPVAEAEKPAAPTRERAARAKTPVEAASDASPARDVTRSRGPFTLEVGAYSDFDRAVEERYRLSQLTGFEGWVVPAAQGSGEKHRVVVGAYRSLDRATSAANMLLRSKTLPRVTVVPLPGKDQRY